MEAKVLSFDRDPNYRKRLRDSNLPKCHNCLTSRSVRVAAYEDNGNRTVVCMSCGGYWTDRQETTNDTLYQT